MMLHPMLWVICVEKNYIRDLLLYSNHPTNTHMENTRLFARDCHQYIQQIHVDV